MLKEKRVPLETMELKAMQLGAAGIQGHAGHQGTQSAAGPTRPQGVAGDPGPQGDAGSAEEQEVARALGEQGEAGDTRAQGPAGEHGAQGDVGAPGNEGAARDNVAEGDAGAEQRRGPAGDKEAQCDPGDVEGIKKHRGKRKHGTTNLSSEHGMAQQKKTKVTTKKPKAPMDSPTIDDEFEEQTQEWDDTLECTLGDDVDETNKSDTNNDNNSTSSGHEEMLMEGKKLLQQLHRVMPKKALKQLLKNSSMKGQRALRLAQQVDVILKARQNKQTGGTADKIKTATRPKLPGQKVTKLPSEGTKQRSASKDKNVSRQDDNKQALEHNEEYYQWKGEWYRWDTYNEKTQKEETDLRVPKEQKPQRVNSRLHNWIIVAMRRNMKPDATAAALQPFSITRDKMDQVCLTFDESLLYLIQYTRPALS